MYFLLFVKQMESFFLSYGVILGLCLGDECFVDLCDVRRAEFDRVRIVARVVGELRQYVGDVLRRECRAGEDAERASETLLDVYFPIVCDIGVIWPNLNPTVLGMPQMHAYASGLAVSATWNSEKYRTKFTNLRHMYVDGLGLCRAI